MNFKKALLDFLATLPDGDDAPEPAKVDGGEPVAKDEPAPPDKGEPGEGGGDSQTIGGDDPEPAAEVDAPKDKPDVTEITPQGAVVGEIIDQRFAAFYEKQNELESALKILAGEVAQMKTSFVTIEGAIDAAKSFAPTVEDMANLVNKI